jgi:serine/threonine protein kinase
LSSPSQTQGSATWIAGRYRIERAIAEGGMGSVYAVRDEKTGATLALKRARGVEQLPHLIELFEREYRTLASLSHPRIIRVHDYGVDGGSPFYTMDLVQGRDLHELAPLPLEKACHYLRDVATCLALLHARRLLHRDITPRNVRVTDDDHCTLLDFGALTSFGIPERTVGTPPCIPPEALRGAPLDQRADLFSFGALAYWTLTRKHAYRARSIEELPEIWQRRVVPPSKLVPGIPEQADALILSLLSLDPNARPSSIADVVDRLSALCKLPPEDEVTQRALADSYLTQTQLVGRTAELKKLEQHVSDLDEGKGSAVIVHGPSGGGRTRLLRELVLKAQLSGVPSILVDAAVSRSAYGTAIALLQRVLDASPDALREATAQAGVLGQLDTSIAARLGQRSETQQAEISGSWRARVQEALHRVIGAACAMKPLLLAIDNADEADEPSLAVLAALRSLTANKLVLALSSESLGLDADMHVRGESFSWRMLRERCQTIPLSPFSLDETYDLIGSVFGGAPGSTRLAQWLHQRCAGLPLHLVELIRKLHVMRVVRYVDGLWIVPAELPTADIPAGLSELLADRLNELSPAARSLAEAIAIQRRSLTRAVCTELAKEEITGNGATLLLDELVRADVLTDTHEGFRFTHGVLRNVLASRMTAERKRTLHMRGAEQALKAASGADTVNARIAAGWHLLQAGEESRGADLLADVTYDTVGIRFAFADLQIAAPALAAALDVYSRQGRSIYERAPLLAALAQAGYYEDRRWAIQYGDEAIAAVSKVAGIELAKKLQPKLGKTLGLLIALATAFVRFKLNRKKAARYGFADLLILLFGVVTTLTGVAAIALDTKRAQMVASTLDPFQHLPERLTPVGIRQFCYSLRDIGREQQAHALRLWTMLTERFNDKRYYPTLPDRARPLYIGGLWFARGVFESMRDGRGALEAADQLDRLDIKLYRMIASELRMLHHVNRGEMALAEQFREQVELHAIQIGSASQVEYFEPAALILPLTAMSDAAGMRAVAQRLGELAETTPSLARYAELAVMARELTRADLLVLGTKQLEASSEFFGIMDRAMTMCLAYEPRELIGWAATLGFCARALNITGRHADALRCCERVRQHMQPEDRMFVALFLAAEVELAVALAGTGKVDEAHAQLDELLKLHATSDNPLTRGRIHEAVARVALITGERDVFTHHLVETRSWFRNTGTPALVARSEALAAYARRSSMPPPEGSLRPLSTIGTDGTKGATEMSESAVEVVTSARRVRRNARGGISLQPDAIEPDTDAVATVVQLPDDSLKP